MDDLASLVQSAVTGRYAVEREVGRGGMATVFLARDLRHGRPVALKAFRPELSALIGRDRFLREIRVTAGFDHPHILPVLDSGGAGSDGPLLWYTMPYVQGESLRGRLQREGRLPPEEAVRLTGEIADALGYAHRHGVVHRDIKPENILLSEGHARVADFGIAQKGQATQGDGRLTETGLVVGTPAYMSPEQSAGGEVDGRSDLYALACVTYEMLAGRPPHGGPTPQAIVARRYLEPYPAPDPALPRVPSAVEPVLRRALATEPRDRFTTVIEYAQALAVAGRAGTIAHSPPEGGGSWRRAVLAAVALTAIAGLVSWWQVRSRAVAVNRSDSGSNHPLLAVLPFQTIGGDTSQQYFTAGITEEITSQLSRLAALRVVSSGVTQAYIGTDRLARMARELGVGSAVTGSVRLLGDRVRISVQLADSRSGQALWSDEYERTVADVFEVQTEIARNVAVALQARLSPADAARLGRRQSVDPAAHDLYLRSGTLSFTDAVENATGRVLLRRAIHNDSTYAQAWADLGVRFYWAAVFGNPSYRDSARISARHALELQPDLPDGYVLLGSIAADEGHLSAARQAYAKALALDESNVPALADLSDNDLTLGRLDDAFRLAVAAAPLGGNDAQMYYHVGNALVRLGDDSTTEAWLSVASRKDSPPYARIEILQCLLDLVRGRGAGALQRARLLLQREPDDGEVRAMLAEVATVLALPDAVELTGPLARENAQARSGGLLTESMAAQFALALHRSGRKAEADSIWGKALAADRRDLAAGKDNPNRVVETAAILAVRGDATTALRWLERADSAGWKDARTLSVDPFFISLHDVPRFGEILRHMSADTKAMRARVQSMIDSLGRISRVN